MAITDWPQPERPREKLLTYGAQSLSDAELLAIFLRTGVPGKTAVDLARDLLTSFGSLRALLGASHQSFCHRPGLGLAKFAQLQAILEMGRRHLKETLQRSTIISNSKDTKTYLSAHLRHHQREVFACLFLDTRHRIINYEELFFGTINAASVHPREIVKRALNNNAAAVILAHNHPSGVAEPSLSDKQITQHIKQALALIDVVVLDHLIIGDGQIFSFAEELLLA